MQKMHRLQVYGQIVFIFDSLFSEARLRAHTFIKNDSN